MFKERKIVKIPRDPRSDNIRFFEDVPESLIELVDVEEWTLYISGLNKIFYKKEKPSVFNFLKNILMMPTLLIRENFDKDVSVYLDQVNHQLKSRGIHIDHPMYTSYTELIVLYFND